MSERGPNLGFLAFLSRISPLGLPQYLPPVERSYRGFGVSRNAKLSRHEAEDTILFFCWYKVRDRDLFHHHFPQFYG